MGNIDKIRRIYHLEKDKIVKRLEEFRQLYLNENDERVFCELVFCLLTPQSKAKLCWDAVVNLEKRELLIKGDVEKIRQALKGVRFGRKKSEYIVNARNFFTENGKICIKSALSKFKDVNKCREWLVKNIKGFGYKEASHFLRNIGMGERFAILDRHILKNLKEFGITNLPKIYLSRKKYLEIEEKMKKFAKKINIPLSHLDFIFWYKETGEIFK